MTNTFKEHLQIAFFETFGHWDIWSERWENMTWPTKRQRQIQIKRQWQIHLENTFKERSLRLFTLETFDQSDEETRPDQQKDNDKDNDKYIWRTPTKSDLWYLWPLRHLLRVVRKHDVTNNKKRQRQILKQRQGQWQIHFDNRFWRHLENSYGNPREVVKLLTFLTIENLKTLQS